MNDRELLKQAYGALGLINHRGNTDEELQKVGLTMVLIEARLAEKEDKPVAWLSADGYVYRSHTVAKHSNNGKEPLPLYLHPPIAERKSK